VQYAVSSERDARAGANVSAALANLIAQRRARLGVLVAVDGAEPIDARLAKRDEPLGEAEAALGDELARVRPDFFFVAVSTFFV
jgi:hypothetical protein